MRIDVDRDICEDHGQCTFAAPEVFSLSETGRLQVADEVADSSRASVEDAADVCPVQAIRILD